MEKHRVLITGACGTIGTVLMNGMSPEHFSIKGLDRIDAYRGEIIPMNILDARFVEEIRKNLIEILENCDSVIHLAWDCEAEGASRWQSVDQQNKRIAEIMFECAAKAKIKRFIVASSVHAATGHVGFTGDCSALADATSRLRRRQEFVKASEPPSVRTLYGASKVYLECLGQAYSCQTSMSIIAVRFGHVTKNDEEIGEWPLRLSHRDCVEFVTRCCLSQINGFQALFAISDNPDNPFDLEEARRSIGYIPRDSFTAPVEQLV